ncbi:cadherin-like and PC-esterase domain-containing protein 1 [Brachionichthys hirsutus]|uniref:cadherin-like and PC-esterase domain-containing protein 1 n=1 Tax=Brachionichthys hirsutus TaxID=412623 RepID=UPI0036045551
MLLLLRRRSGPLPVPVPVLLLLGAGGCLFYRTLVVVRNRLRSGPPPAEEGLMEETRRIISVLESSRRQVWTRRRAVLLTGRHLASDPEVQLYQWVLQQLDYEVQMSRYAETSSFLRANQGVSGWSLLLCLGSSERSCLRRMSLSHLQHHQRVNLLPEVKEAFSDAGGGLCDFYARSHLTESELPMMPHSCGSTNQKLQVGPNGLPPAEAPPPALVAMVNLYVLVTSMNPLTSFLHDISVVKTNEEPRGRATKLRKLLLQQLGPAASHDALQQMKKVVGEVLKAAVSTNQEPPAAYRCVLCYQLLTFTLLFSRTLTPVVIQVDTDLTFSSLSPDAFDRQITRDLVLEDTLRFLLPTNTHLPPGRRGRQDDGCRGTNGVCLSDEDVLLLLQFEGQMKTSSSSASSAFHPLHPSVSSSSSSSSSGPHSVSDLLVGISRFYQRGRRGLATNETARRPAASSSGPCVDPHLRQIYTDPPLSLTPPFSPWIKEYRVEVAFDTVTVRIRPEPVTAGCRVHLDDHQGPRMANYPVGLGNSRISILVTEDAGPEPVVMTIYTVHMYRENRPSLPMFGDHMTCGFMQDCGLRVQPGRSCGLQPSIRSQRPLQACSSGHAPGQWLVPCLSCSDNRTCDWREVAWQPDGCYHPIVDRLRLQDCMRDRKVLFIGDSTNRGMMFFLMERLNSSLVDWGQAHDTLVYRNLNGGRTLAGYSYYPQFWLDRKLRPTFRQALLQLLDRSRPLANSNRTVLMVGGVQWLNTAHLRTIRDVLNRESLGDILVVLKSLGMGFHLPVDGIRSLSLTELRELYRTNHQIITAAKHHGYEAVDTFSITMGRYKEFLQGRCACHFHQVETFGSAGPSHNTMSTTNRSGSNSAGTGLDTQSYVLDKKVGLKAPSYHVSGPVNEVYSEILLSRLCPRT